MAYEFLHRRRVEFAETDTAGVMHFSNLFRFMEATEHAFFRSLGLSIHPSQSETSPSPSGVGWPRIHASGDFRAPLRFEEEVEVQLLVEKVRKKTIHYFFQIWKNPDSGDQRQLAATGRIATACVSFPTESCEMKAISIPEEVREKIQPAPPDRIPEVIEKDRNA